MNLDNRELAEGIKYSAIKKIASQNADKMVKLNHTVSGCTYDVLVESESEKKGYVIVIPGAIAYDKETSESISRVSAENEIVLEYVLFVLPRDREIEVIGLEQKIFEHLLDNFPSDIDILSSATTIDEVANIDIDLLTVDIEANTTKIEGSFDILVDLNYGKRDDSESMRESFYTEFAAKMDLECNIEEMTKLDIDTRPFHT